MSSNARPVTVLIVSCVYIAVGVVGFVYHVRELMALQDNSVWIELTELLAILSGAFILLGRNWARWLALAWMVFTWRSASRCFGRSPSTFYFSGRLFGFFFGPMPGAIFAE
jgi:hypothetical protein